MMSCLVASAFASPSLSVNRVLQSFSHSVIQSFMSRSRARTVVLDCSVRCICTLSGTIRRRYVYSPNS